MFVYWTLFTFLSRHRVPGSPVHQPRLNLFRSSASISFRCGLLIEHIHPEKSYFPNSE